MTKIDGFEVVGSYDLYTVHGSVGGEACSVVCEDEVEAYRQQEQIGGDITVSTHYATEERMHAPEVTSVA